MIPVSPVKLTRTGPTLSRLVLGMWRLASWHQSPDDLLRLIHACLDQGLTTFDHADIYGDHQCERLFGDVLEQLPGLRERMKIVTKCGIQLISEHRPHTTIKHYDTSREHIIASVEESLRALRTDRVEVLLLHRPDPLMHAEEVAEAFCTLREAGKVRHFGVSNFTPPQFDLLAAYLPFPLVTNQVEYSLLHLDPMDDGTFDQCQRLHVAPMVWSPFGGGRLFTGEDEQARRVHSALEAVGQELGASIDQVALAWLLLHPVRVLPILGTGRLDRILSAVAAEDLEMTRQQWFRLLEATTGSEVA